MSRHRSAWARTLAGRGHAVQQMLWVRIPAEVEDFPRLDQFHISQHLPTKRSLLDFLSWVTCCCCLP